MLTCLKCQGKGSEAVSAEQSLRCVAVVKGHALVVRVCTCNAERQAFGSTRLSVARGWRSFARRQAQAADSSYCALGGVHAALGSEQALSSTAALRVQAAVTTYDLKLESLCLRQEGDLQSSLPTFGVGGAGDKSKSTYVVLPFLSDFTGSVLRLDVDTDVCSVPYSIPRSNPHFNSTNQPPEVFAHGLHDPGR